MKADATSAQVSVANTAICTYINIVSWTYPNSVGVYVDTNTAVNNNIYNKAKFLLTNQLYSNIKC